MDLLRAIELLSPTSEQLQKWSQRFDQPFTDVQFVRRRLRRLRAAGLVRDWPLVIASCGTLPHYYKLTPDGFRMLYGHDAIASRKRAFAPIGLARHEHTKALADFIVHIAVGAHQCGVQFADPYPENAYCLQVGGEALWFDWRFRLRTPSGSYAFNVELDCSTETIVSLAETDTVARKIRLIDAADAQYDAFDPRRSVTIFVTTRSDQRMRNILRAAATIVRNPRRALIYGIYLPHCLATEQPLMSRCFSDNRTRSVALLTPSMLRPKTIETAPQLACTAYV